MDENREPVAPQGRSPDVQVRNATFRLGGITLFENLSVTIAAREITYLLGLTGINKSSLLKLLAGPGPGLDTGSMDAGDGQTLNGRIAYMDQSDLLLPRLNVLDNVTLGARLHGETVDMDRTMMEDRPIVLMDEPFSALDALTRQHLQDLAGILLEDRTVLVVTHDPIEAVRLGHRVHVMAGLLARIDTIKALSGRPPRDPIEAQAPQHYRELMGFLHQTHAVQNEVIENGAIQARPGRAFFIEEHGVPS